MKAIGIDLGQTGAIAALSDGGRITLHDMPLKADGTRPSKSEKAPGRVPDMRVDGAALARLLRALVAPDESVVVSWEAVFARPTGNGGREGNSIQSQGMLLRCRGAVEGVFDCLAASNVGRLVFPGAVQPQTWKRHFDLIGKDKDAARLLAIKLFPSVEKGLARKKDINRADALLIAAYLKHRAERGYL
jgi:hypothetical protein